MANSVYGPEYYNTKSVTTRNTNTLLNINSPTVITLPIMGSVDAGVDTTFFTVNSTLHTLTVLFSGKLRIYGSIYYEGAASRANVQAIIYVNGVARPAIFSGGYVRGTQGHNNASTVIATTIDVTTNDVVEIRVRQGGSTGVLTMGSVNSSVVTFTKELPNE